MRALLPLLPFTLLLACPSAEKETGDPVLPLGPEGIALRADGWRRGDLHVRTSRSDGADDPATTVALAAWLRSDALLDRHPGYQENHLDFLGVTDDDAATADDPGWRSDDLTLVPGARLACDGALGVHGVSPLPAWDAPCTLEALEAAVEAVREAGGVTVVHHPLLATTPFPWDLRGIDALEVWSGGWTLQAPPSSEDTVAAWEARNGPAGAPFRRALEVRDAMASDQALVLYEALLSRGTHAALVGGSNRHAVLLPGFPTTFVLAGSDDPADLLQAIRDRHTFVSRTPVSAQVLVWAETDAGPIQMGDAVPVPTDGATFTLQVRVGRADGATLEMVQGGWILSDDDLPGSTVGQVMLQEPVVGDDYRTEFEVTAHPGVWVYPRVVEPLLVSDTPAELREEVRALADAAWQADGEAWSDLGAVFGDLLDPGVLANGSTCEPAAWPADDLPLCVPADGAGQGTFFVPDLWDRALHVVVDDHNLTDRTLGAVGSAIRFVEE